MKYAQRLKILRTEKKLNQKEIAILLNTSQSYYAQYELNKRPLPINHLIILCKYYQISADYILGFTEEKKHLPKE